MKVARKQRGAVDELPSGALRVRVYAGQDPVSGKRHDLVEVIPGGPTSPERGRGCPDPAAEPG